MMDDDITVHELCITFTCSCEEDTMIAINSLPDFHMPYTCTCGKVYEATYDVRVIQH